MGTHFAVEMEQASAPVTNAESRRLRFPRFADERFPSRAFFVRDPEKLPKRQEVVGFSAVRGATENVRVRRGAVPAVEAVGYDEGYNFQSRRIEEFPARGFRMVDIRSARSERRARMLVPIEEVHRVDKRIRIVRIGRNAFEGAGEKLPFAGFEL